MQLAFNLAGICCKANGWIYIADFSNNPSHKLIHNRSGKWCCGGYFSRYTNIICCNKGFTCYPTLGIMLQAEVQNGITDLVGNLVGMPHRNGFTGKEIILVHNLPRFVKQSCSVTVSKL